ncbi:MAG: helix-turn-helix domain-containing protein [Oscillospiraceae bacterium]|nr:helix-turn-helix domain-containing protein [Oscillospiraceae bacterium]
MGFYERGKTTVADSNGVVPQNVKRILQERGLSVMDAARLFDMEYPALYYRLCGHQVIRVCDIFAIADALAVDPAELLRRCQ